MIIKRCSYGLITLVMTLLLGMTGYANTDSDKPEVILSNYKEIPIWIETSATIVTDQEVEAAIQDYLELYVEWVEVTNRPAQIGDSVLIDYVGYMNGVLIEGGQSENQMLLLGSGSFIDGFETQLVGSNKGDVVEVNVTFPNYYGVSGLAGRNAVFYVTVNSISCKQKAELNDAFAQSISNCNTVAELRQYVREMLEQRNQHAVDIRIQSMILNHIVDNSTFYNIQGSVNQRVKNHIDDITINYNLPFFQYANIYGLTEREMKQYLNDVYMQQVKSEVILESIADIEKLVPSEEDWLAAANSNGLSDVETFVALYGEGEANDLAQQYAVYRFLLASAHVIDGT